MHPIANPFLLMLPILLVVLTLLYVLIVLGLVIGIHILPPPRRRLGDRRSSISVIVPARNEETTVAHCLEALSHQSYPSEHYEVIVVDDRSSDATAEIVRRWAGDHPNVRLVHSSGQERYACPKKNALSIGIEASSGEILMFTDADCNPGYFWIEGMENCFDKKTGLVAGFSPIEGGGDRGHQSNLPRRHDGSITAGIDGATGETATHASRAACTSAWQWLVDRLLRVEGVAIAALSAGSMGIGMPLACSARNLAYRRQVYDEIGGFDRIGHIVSGDDVLVMRQVAERTSWRIAWCMDPRATVPTRRTTPESRSSLFQRKLRHASKAIHYSPPIVAVASLVYLFHLLYCLTPLLYVTGLVGGGLLTLVIAAKWTADLTALGLGSRRLGARLPVLSAVLFEFAYPIHIVVFGALGTFSRFRWR